MKKFIAILLSLLMLFSVFSALTVSAGAVETNKVYETVSDFENDDTEILVSSSSSTTDAIESSQNTDPSEDVSQQPSSSENTTPSSSPVESNPSGATEATEPSEEMVTSIYLPQRSASIYVQGIFRISAIVYNGKGQTTLTSSNERVATVNAAGVITGVSKGSAVIYIENNGIKASFTVTVKNPEISVPKKTLLAGESVTIKIIGCRGKAEFQSTNKKVVTVNSNGVIKANRAGSAKIRIKTNGLSFIVHIIVKENLKINKSYLGIYKGRNYQLKVSGTKKTITWTSSDKKIATVSKSGKITAKKTGSATITASTGSAKIRCKVFVYKKTKEVQKRIKLKNYVLKYCSESDNKENSIYTKYALDGDTPMECGVMYSPKHDKLYLLTVLYLEDATIVINMPVSVGNKDTSKVECIMNMTDNITCFYSYKTVNIKKYTTKKNIKFAKYTSSNVTNKEIQTLSNGCLQIAVKGMNKFLKQHCKTTLKSIGFIKWNK